MGMNLYLYKKPIDLLLCVVVTTAKIQEIFQHHIHITTIRTSPIKLTHQEAWDRNEIYVKIPLAFCCMW